jgi:hypothetical protein
VIPGAGRWQPRRPASRESTSIAESHLAPLFGDRCKDRITLLSERTDHQLLNNSLGSPAVRIDIRHCATVPVVVGSPAPAIALRVSGSPSWEER